MRSPSQLDLRSSQFGGMLRAVAAWRVLWLLLFAGLIGSPAPVAGQSISPLEFSPQIPVFNGFTVNYHYGWRATWSAPLGVYIFSVQASWPRPPIEQTDEQRCNTSGSNGGQVSVALPRPVDPGSYSVTIILKRCLWVGGAYQITPVATAAGWGVIEDDGSSSGGSGPAPPQLKILPQTTRWRPQRDTTEPILVRFRGPTGLDTSTVRLEVAPPAGVSTYSATIGTATLVDGTTDDYAVPWTGPWTVPDGSGGQQPLPSGNYRLVLRGRPAGAAEDLVSDPYEKVSLVEVVGIELQPVDGGALDQNPGAAGAGAIGMRMFAEAVDQPTRANPQPIVLDRVRVAARLSPAIEAVQGQPSVKVFFRAIDVDDPSAGSKPVDDEGRTADNRGDAPAGLFTASFVPSGATPDAGIGAVLEQTAESAEEAAVVARVSPRAGDNYRFLASTSRPWVEPLKARQGPTPGGGLDSWLVDGQGTAVAAASEGVQVSEVLTVWRTLHVELDRLVPNSPAADQAAMDVTGTFTGLKNTSLDDNTAPFVSSSTATHWAPHNRINGWQGGEMRVAFHSNDLYDVVANGTKDVSVALRQSQIGLLNGLTSAQAMLEPNRGYVLQDDHMESLLTMSADVSLATQLLGEAYIRVVAHGAADQSADIPFVMSPYTQYGQSPLDRRNLEQPSLYSMPSEGMSKPFYWSVQVVSAFEGDPAQDKDPQTEQIANLGETSFGSCHDGTAVIGGCKNHAAVYLEAIRDLAAKPQGYSHLPAVQEIVRRATAHELFHGLGLVHGQAIMCAGKMLDTRSSTGNRLDVDHVEFLRKLTVPVMSKSRKQDCP